MPASNDLPFSIVLLLLLTALGSWLLTLTRHHRETLRQQLQLFLAALGVRFMASVAIYEFGLVKILGDEDGSGWYLGVVMLKDWTQRHMGFFDLPVILAEAFQQQHRGYYYLLGGLFYLTDSPARMPAAALNCFFGALIVVFAYRIADSLFSRWVAVRVGWLACFFPSLIVWSAQTVKEPVVILLETVALYACVHLKLTGFSWRYILLCGSAIIMLLPFRFYAAYLAAAAALLALVVPQFRKGHSSIFAGVAIAVLVIPLAVSSGILVRSEAQIERFDLNSIRTFRRNIAAGSGSGVTTNYDFNSPVGLVTGTAIGAAHLLLAPFPWQLGGASLRMLLTLPEVLVWWWLVFYGLLPGLWLAIRKRFGEIQPLLIFIAGLGLLYSMLFGNVGLIVRQRAQLLPWLMIFALVGLEQRRLKRALKQQANNHSYSYASVPQHMARERQA
ncbi:MAG: hypothetical protein ABI977_06995 [Acidobacteriota bacterium]